MTFEDFLQQKKLIPKTISRHQREKDKYQNWLQNKRGYSPENATQKDLLDYLKHIKKSRKLASATQSQMLQILKNYHAYLSQEHQIPNITHFIKIRGTNRKHLRPLFTPEELELLCDAYYYHSQHYQPNRKELRFYPDHKKLLQSRYIALTLTAHQALSQREILKLTAASFDLRKAQIRVQPSRKGSARTLPLQASQIGTLMQFFANTAADADDDQLPILPNLNQIERLSQTLKTLDTKFQDLQQIRASKITHWIKLHGLRKAQHLAGHSAISSTERYLSNDIQTLQDDMQSFHPLG